MTLKGYTVSEILGLQVLSEYGDSAKKEVKSVVMPNSGVKGFLVFSAKEQKKHEKASSPEVEEFKRFIRAELEQSGLKKKPSMDTYYEIPNSVTIGELLDVKDRIIQGKKPHVDYELYIYVVRNGDFFLL